MKSEQKHMDTVEEAKKLLSDGDENYKLHTVIWLYQQSEKVTKLEAERSELLTLLGDILAGFQQFGTIYSKDEERIKEAIK